MYCFLDFFVLNFLKFLNKLCIYGANGLWSGATSISDGIFIVDGQLDMLCFFSAKKFVYTLVLFKKEI